MWIIKKSDNFQIEDWSKEFPNFPYMIGCYPTVTKLPSYNIWHRLGEGIRISINCKTKEEAESRFTALTEGKKTIRDYSEFVHDPRTLNYID